MQKNQFEEAGKFDQTHELYSFPDPSQNYLAGADRSWWWIAFAERLAQLENGSLINSGQIGMKKTEFKKSKKSKRSSSTNADDPSVNDNATSNVITKVKTASENEELSSTLSQYW